MTNDRMSARRFEMFESGGHVQDNHTYELWEWLKAERKHANSVEFAARAYLNAVCPADLIHARSELKRAIFGDEVPNDSGFEER